MKFGVRKVSLKKSLSARTTGKLKRGMKRAYNPAYGKKGAGLVNNPKKAVYNKVYNKTSVSVSDLVGGSTGGSFSGNNSHQEYGYYSEQPPKKPKNKKVWKYLLIFFVYALFLYVPLINVLTIIGLFGLAVVLGIRAYKAFLMGQNFNQLIKYSCVALVAAVFGIAFLMSPQSQTTTTETTTTVTTTEATTTTVQTTTEATTTATTYYVPAIILEAEENAKTTAKPLQDKEVYISKTGKKYHYSSSCSNGNYTPIDLSAAEERGYTPCKKCAGG